MKGLIKRLINEAFDSQPFEFNEISSGNNGMKYSFVVNDDITMLVDIKLKPHTDMIVSSVIDEFELSENSNGAYLYVDFGSEKYGPKSLNLDIRTSLKIISTIKVIVEDVINNKLNGLELMMIYSSPSSNGEKNTRKKIYDRLYSELIANGFKKFEYFGYSGVYK